MFSLFAKKAIPVKERITKKPHPVVLIILDGYGISPIREGNAVWNANTPNLDSYEKKYPKALLHTAGNEVGLPYGEFGNSEVGHLNIGSGRVVYQPLLRVSNEIEAGNLYNNEAMDGIKKHLKKTGGALHLMGLLSPGGVHSHIEHLFAILDWCKDNKIKKIFIHVFTDGRDAPQKSGAEYIEDLIKKIEELNINAQIASLSGRYFAMDRDRHWDRLKKAYQAWIGTGKNRNDNPSDAITESYKEKKTDEFLDPVVITDKDGKPLGPISGGNALLMFNLRPDRSRQTLMSFVSNSFGSFKTKKIDDLFVATLTEYDPKLKAKVVFPEKDIKNPLGEILSKKGLKQFHIAETEKYAHVTYFFNGGREKPFKGETRVIVPSPSVPTYDKKPEMSCEKIAIRVLEELEKGKEDFFVINFANADMVGHTGNYKAILKAVEAVDQCVGKIVEKTLILGGAAIITADHGNAEETINSQSSEKDTEHNIYPAPFIVISHDLENKKETLNFKEAISEPIGSLADIAPTILDLMGIEQPTDMTGISLLNSLK
ncbi:MAG: 2,3-bisphosphoglycerate-independent phosphoglycerate mutase [Patescibacteria group bacterium]|nr:2,3-bisphosphoglycerate-independent phosphoglycerate mutase [Patescibacteria group bacterium]